MLYTSVAVRPRPKLRWLDGVEKDLRTLGIRGWKRRALDRQMERNLDSG